MSAATKRKYVAQEFLEGCVLPDPDRQQEIVQIVAPRGNNLHEVLNGEGITYLVSMPPKFRKTVWIKRGDYVLVEPITEGDRVKAEITHILRTKDQIAHIKAEGKWPPAFDKKEDEVVPAKQSSPSDDPACPDSLPGSDDTDESSDDDGDLSPNLNRVNGPQHFQDSDSDESSSSESSAELV
ncbi:putative RNA-binding protein EIF1AD [Hypsibius exemplaris]|uniref:Probable RNA-binding protein EIF1AD n=1 Tax=Hypsibius exemplaris TaxID=2072580 RepID=A0A1W0WM97_HYPEX|nr:putative RNA-binding protein EIF1AD [Hypsibius exemplaris]